MPAAPRSSPTGLAPLPALAPAALSAASTPHLANIAAVSFPKTAASPGFVESLKSFCPAPVAPPPPTTDGSVSAPPSVCRWAPPGGEAGAVLPDPPGRKS